MPYRRRTTGTYKRRYKSKRRVAPAVKRYVKRVVNKAEETKYIDVLPNITASSVTFGYVDLLGGISQGTSIANRIGDKIKLIGIRYLLQLLPGDNENVCRTLLLNYVKGGAASSAPSALQTLLGPVTTRSSFVVYKDWVHEARYVPVDGSTSTTVSLNKYYQGFIKLNKIINYGGTANPVTNTMMLQLHSDSLAAPNPGITGYFRVYFKDA